VVKMICISTMLGFPIVHTFLRSTKVNSVYSSITIHAIFAAAKV
jgi:hypothetical protein